jgi:hypothetical protein
MNKPANQLHENVPPAINIRTADTCNTNRNIHHTHYTHSCKR